MKTLIVLFALISILLTPITGSSQPGDRSAASDARVKRTLDEAKINYTIDEDGDFKLVFEFKNGRSQVVFINSNTEKYRDFEIREIWSPGYSSRSEFNAKVANRLLAHNFETKIGAWQVRKLNDENVALFTAKISAVLSIDQLRSILELVSEVADEMEKELTQKDDF